MKDYIYINNDNLPKINDNKYKVIFIKYYLDGNNKLKELERVEKTFRNDFLAIDCFNLNKRDWHYATIIKIDSDDIEYT
jgi:hypothetical protein